VLSIGSEANPSRSDRPTSVQTGAHLKTRIPVTRIVHRVVPLSNLSARCPTLLDPDAASLTMAAC
jgi:hypothetical protein